MTEIFTTFCLFTRTKFCENPLSGSSVFFRVTGLAKGRMLLGHPQGCNRLQNTPNLFGYIACFHITGLICNSSLKKFLPAANCHKNLQLGPNLQSSLQEWKGREAIYCCQESVYVNTTPVSALRHRAALCGLSLNLLFIYSWNLSLFLRNMVAARTSNASKEIQPW